MESIDNNSEIKKTKKKINPNVLLVILGIALGILVAGSFGINFTDKGKCARVLGETTTLFEESGKTWVPYNEPIIGVTVISDKNCETCNYDEVVKMLKANLAPTLEIKGIEFDSSEGEQLINALGIKTLPAFVFGPKITEIENYEKVAEVFIERDGQYLLDSAKVGLPVGRELASAGAVKSDRPFVELFVMSHCPYGTQIEKGILPVLETLGDKIDFELKFCDYAMHKEKEMDEQLKQYCIQSEEPTKFVSYLECFLEADKSDECLKENNINISKLNACVSATDARYKITESFNDKSTWRTDRNGNPAFPIFNVYKEDVDKYSVGGSPTLVINGTTAKSGRDAAGLLAIICSGFNNPPEECSAELSSETPSPGFGFGTTTNGDSASCN